jgi:DNA repair exonuclease SbcCD ATPase subunit
MRLLSVTLRNYRIHKELSVSFDPARNLIGGPNESGKSTLAEAIHRALFLRAKTGGGIQKEMASSIHHGEPEVSLRFEAGGVTWELEKRFAGPKGSTRLTGAGMTAHKDEEADTKLSEILKTESGGRANASQLASTWSHLWVWQGSSGEDPAGHASIHKDTLVQRLQKDGIAAVMQSATDQRVRGRIAAAYDELFTGTGKPKAGSKPEFARLQLTKAEEDLQRAQETAARLDQAVNDHARVEKEIAEADSVLPGLREQHAAAEAKLTQVKELRLLEETQCRTFQTATTTREQISKDDAKIRELHQQGDTARTALNPAEEKQTALTIAEETARAASQAAETAYRHAADAVRQARLHHDLSTAILGALEKSEAHRRLATRSKEVDTVRLELSRVQTDLSKLPLLTSKDLNTLRKLDRDANQATATLEAMATGIELLQSDTTVTLDGLPLTPNEVRILADVGELTIGNGTRLRIRPGGGSSLSEARALAASAQGNFSDALARHTLRDLDHAAAVCEQRQTLEQQIAQHETRWKALGGASLAAELATAANAMDAANAEVQRRKDALGGESLVPFPTALEEARAFLSSSQEKLSQAETAESSARRIAEQTLARLETATGALQLHRDQITSDRQSLRDLETSIRVLEETHGDAPARQTALAKARDAEQHASDQLAATRKVLAELAPETLAADLDRFQRAITQQETRRREAEDRRITARAHLTLDGSSDPQSDLSHALARCEAARELNASEQRRAKAIEKLHQLFSSSREAIDRSLVQPLADRISGYLQCLFGPGAEVRVNLSDSGIEGLDLIRTGDPAFGFSSLSGGAKEQVAAAVRLAMAEILATDHDGCLPILFDDAFAYTDPERVQSLQRMLNLAAIRGLQVIVLTCAPADYSAFGAEESRLS